MLDRPIELEAEFLRESAARLRRLAQEAAVPSIASKLLDLAEDLERRAAQLSVAGAAEQG